MPVVWGLALSTAGGLAAGSGQAEDEAADRGEEVEAPAPVEIYPLDRYAELWQRSLFHAPVPAPKTDAAFARDYHLAGIFEMDGETTAALVHRRDGSVVNVSDAGQAGSGPSAGMRLIEVDAAAAGSGQSRVQIEKDGQRAWISALPTGGGGSVSAPGPVSASSATAPPAATSEWENFSISAPPVEPEVPAVPVPTPPAPPSPTDIELDGPHTAIPLPPSPVDVEFEAPGGE